MAKEEKKNSKHVVAYILITIFAILGIAMWIGRVQTAKASAYVPPITIIDTRTKPGNSLASYQNVEIVSNDDKRLVFRHTMRVVVGGLYPDQDALITYSLDKKSGYGVWTQEFPDSIFLKTVEGQFEMRRDSGGYLAVSKTADGEFSKEFVVTGID